MAPFFCLIAGLVAFRALGVAFPYFVDWHVALRASLGLMFLLTASAHWGRRRPDLLRMVPERIGSPGVWVSVTGLAEVAIAISLQIPRLAPWIAAVSVMMLCALFPANAKAAREHLTILKKPVLPFLPRLALQAFFIGALIASVWPH